MRTVGGHAYCREHMVVFNPKLLAQEGKTSFLNTIIHEVAHLVHYVLKRGWSHNYYWKYIFRKMGGDGKRCHDYDVSAMRKPVVKKVASTPKTVEKSFRERAVKNRRMYIFACSVCGSTGRYSTNHYDCNAHHACACGGYNTSRWTGGIVRV